MIISWPNQLEHDQVILQFGKVRKEMFTMDYWSNGSNGLTGVMVQKPPNVYPSCHVFRRWIIILTWIVDISSIEQKGKEQSIGPASSATFLGITEVELALAKRKNVAQLDADYTSNISYGHIVKSGKSVKAFNFMDERIMDGQWVKEPNSDIMQRFLRVLGICHTPIPDVNKDTGELSYEAESPDEAAFVIAVREVRFEFFQRTQTSISLHEY